MTALMGLAAGALLAPLPVRPLGRTRWAATLAGVSVPLLTQLFVVLFTDPPPFQPAPPLHGSPVAFLAVCAVVGAVAVALYQLVRGAGHVATATIGLAALGGGWVTVSAHRLPAASATPASGAPPVLLVTLDTLRADRVGAWGNREVDTRHLDTLAREGARFANTSAVAAVTGPSHAAMLSGTGPWVNGVLLNGIPIPEDRPLLAERLHDAGWATAAFVSAYVLEGDLGFNRGFSVYDDDFGLLPGFRDLLVPRAFDMTHRFIDPDWVLERRGADTVDHALAWIEDQEGPWFAWVHLFDPHGPYAPPPPWDTAYYAGDPRDPAHTSMQRVTGVASYLKPSLEGITDLQYVLSQYDGEVSYTDSQLGRLLAAVPEDTLVVVIGDHGESLGEHGVWFNHGDDLYETSLHVPFVMRWRGKLDPTVITAPVEGSDLAPTVLARLGLSRDGMGGRDALTEPRESAASMCFDRETNLVERREGRITAPRWRLASLRGETDRWVEREIDDTLLAFDLSADPAGLAPLPAETLADPAWSARAALTRDLTRALFAGDSARSAATLSDEERAKLEALGYLNPQ
jgi:arylsulfatase